MSKMKYFLDQLMNINEPCLKCIDFYLAIKKIIHFIKHNFGGS